MTEIKFYDIGCALLIVDKVLNKAVEYVESLTIENDVTIDLNHCMMNYDFSELFDAVITKLEGLSGEKTITVVHSFHQAHEYQLINYFVQFSKKIVDQDKLELSKINAALKSNYNVTIKFVENGDG